MTQDNRAAVRKVLIITLLLNIFVMVLKALVGNVTGSLSLLADALQSVAGCSVAGFSFGFSSGFVGILEWLVSFKRKFTLAG
ncbi:cation diffusion facilitator family transporter [Scytonema sp. HK-05]|nr:cation diffusion facilitator family transporter [Scytonema sp. HK-05]